MLEARSDFSKLASLLYIYGKYEYYCWKHAQIPQKILSILFNCPSQLP
jgi:hypothetical protein